MSGNEDGDLPVLGGFGSTEDATEDIQAICEKVKTHVEGQTNQKYQTYKAEKYRSQVVAGTNYLIKVDVGDGQYLHLEVYRSLSGEIELKGVQKDKGKDHPLLTSREQSALTSQSQLPASSS